MRPRYVFFFQAPQSPSPTAPPPAVILRKIRPGDRSRYQVVSDWEGPGAKSHFDYRMNFEVEKTKEPKAAFTVVVRMIDLTADYDGIIRRNANFGVIPIQLGAAGAPQGISAGGPITNFAVPLLAFTLPDLPPGPDGGFDVPGIRLATVGSFKGSGQIETKSANGETITLRLALGASTLDLRSAFNADGALIHSDGTYVCANGKLTFKVDRR